MSNTFTLTGTLKDGQQNPIAGAYVKFRIMSVGTDTADSIVYPKGTFDFISDANGVLSGVSGSETIWINGDSGLNTIYEVELPGSERKQVVIPSAVDGTTVDLSTILEDYLFTGAVPVSPVQSVSGIQFSTDNPASGTSAGLVRWNDTDKAIEYIADSSVTIQVGQELVVRARNATGVTISNGKVVRISGAVGSRPKIVLAQADSLANVAGVIGVTTEDILNGEDGMVTVIGLVRGLDTSSFVAGDELFLSSTVAGDYTTTEPDISVRVGVVTKSNVATGEIHAHVAPAIAAALEIGVDVQAWDAQLDDIAALAVTDGNIIVGNGTNWVAESGATARTSLGLTIGTDVQAFGAVLDDLNTLGAAATDGEFIVATGAGAFAYESGATVRTSLGLGTGDTPEFNGADMDGGELILDADGDTSITADTDDQIDIRVGGTDLIAIDSTGMDVEGIVEVDRLQLETTAAAGPYTRGIIRWDNTFRCPEYDNGDDAVTNLVGQEVHLRVANFTGSTILKDSIVRINGNASGFPTITLAQADSLANAKGVAGFAAHDIETSSAGTIVVIGRVGGTLNTSAAAYGDTLYLSDSTPGGFTNTPPAIRVKVGVVSIDSSSLGEIYARIEQPDPIIGTDVQAWDAQLDDIAALTPTDGNIIVGDGANWVAESGATARASLGLTIGTNVQAWDTDLDTIAAADNGANVASINQNLSTTDNVTFGNVTTNGQTITNGSVKAAWTAVSSTSYSVLTADYKILVDDDTAGSEVTLTLPAAATAGDGFEILVLKKGSTANVVIDGNGSETINGQLTQTLFAQYDSFKISTDGTEWFIIEA